MQICGTDSVPRDARRRRYQKRMSTIRPARPDEFATLGRFVVDAYQQLPGMPDAHAQPGYYAMLADVAARARNPAITIFAAVGDDGELAGSVDFIADVASYNSGADLRAHRDAAGIRLLAVDAAHRGAGVGRALTERCLDEARARGKASVVLHTTRAMTTAWRMYERLGFRRCEEIDFRQGELEVFGFVLRLG
jgi:ribosomal protein S18 acetylase RimI-like enzyme